MDQIERAAMTMAGEVWAGMSDTIKEQYRELARRAQPVFHNGQAVPWEHVAVTLSVVLTEHAGSLTAKRADSETRQRIARDQTERLKLCRYTVVAGPPAEGAGGHFFGDAKGKP
ncbi:hypothetical protein [Azospirillum sp.]|uniref:hypothetical protein n=1 Tax=Azospirillum sp. TaxID=34012 RepID=UPI003D739E7F